MFLLLSQLGSRGWARRSAGRMWLAVLVSLLGLPAMDAQARGIAQVSISGSVSHPQITITGTGLGSEPAPDPQNPAFGSDPSNGYDYGENLYLSDLNSPSSKNGAWTAGFYDGQGHGYDAIGLVVSSFTDTQVAYSLGADYSSYYQPNSIYNLTPGDTFSVTVNGLTCQGTVSYSGAPVNCQTSPPPHHKTKIAARIVPFWNWSGPRTQLLALQFKRLPHNAVITITCAGQGCPTHSWRATARHASGLVRPLTGRNLYVGARLTVAISAPGRLPERARFVTRNGEKPSGRLL
jgi:hypothetical protein